MLLRETGGDRRRLTIGSCLRSLRSLRSIRRRREGAGEVFVVAKVIELVRWQRAGSGAFVRYLPSAVVS